MRHRDALISVKPYRLLVLALVTGVLATEALKQK